MKAVVLIIGVCLIILLLGAVMAGIRDFRSAEISRPYNVTTAAGITSANITLTQDLYDDDTAYITITSNITGDAAVPFSYTPATRSLLVSGLAENSLRQLSVEYRYNQLDTYWGADLASKVWPLFLGLGIIGIIIGAVIVGTRKD